MADEQAAVAVEAPAENAQVTDVEPKESTDWAPLFESETAVSEAELMGEAGLDDEQAGPAEKESAGGDKPKDEAKADDAGKDESAQAPAKPDKPDKPPEGYVPYEALNEERGKRQRLSQENAALQQELLQLREVAQKAPAKEDPWKDFKVLDRVELEALWDEDPAKATMYVAELPKFFESKRERAAAEEAQRRAEHDRDELVRSSFEMMERMVPGLTKDAEVSKKLTDFAVSKGVSVGTLQALTNPQTRVVMPDGRSVMLGPSAAEIVGLVAGFHGAASTDETQIRAKIEAEIRPQIEKEITQQLMSKFKSGSDFRSLDMAAGSSGKAPMSKHRVSEAEYARMSPVEQEKYLMMEDGP